MAKKGGGTQTVVTAPDAQTQARNAQLWGMAQRAGSMGLDPQALAAINQAKGVYGNAINTGNLGLGALGGDPSSIAAFQNPYTDNVVNAAMGDFGHLRDLTLNGVSDQATAQGAFGGSRQGVAEGVALGDINRGMQSQMANLRQTGFGDSMNRAYMAANLGFGGASGMQGIGQYLDQNTGPGRQFNYLQQAMGAMPPVGRSETTTGTPGHNFFTGAVGGIGAGAALGGWGALAGGLLGGFGAMM
jgi:hypothetical protein